MSSERVYQPKVNDDGICLEDGINGEKEVSKMEEGIRIGVTSSPTCATRDSNKAS